MGEVEARSPHHARCFALLLHVLPTTPNAAQLTWRQPHSRRCSTIGNVPPEPGDVTSTTGKRGGSVTVPGSGHSDLEKRFDAFQDEEERELVSLPHPPLCKHLREELHAPRHLPPTVVQNKRFYFHPFISPNHVVM